MSRGKKWIMMDLLKRKLFLKYELKNNVNKGLMRNSSFPLVYRYLVFYQKIKTPRWAILPQIVNRCSKTGRSLSVLKHTKISRFVFRTESYNGDLPGFKRASW